MMAGQDRGMWRRTKVHIINKYIYQLIREVKWVKTRIIIKNVCKGLHWENPWTTRSCKVVGYYFIIFLTHTLVAGHL